MPRPFSRPFELRRLRQRLQRFGWPRAEMTSVVMLTGLGGFVVSALLLHLGWLTLWSRWLAALVGAYLMFLGMLGAWLHWRRDFDDDVVDLDGLPDISSGHQHHSSGLGDHAAAAHLDGNAGSAVDAATVDHGGVLDGIGDAFGADEAAIPLLLIGIVLAIAGSFLFASVWLVASAPTLFAELLLDCFLAASLYRRLRARAGGHWLETALRHTWIPFLVTAVVLVGAGFFIQHLAPDAHTLGEALAFWRG